MEELYEKYAKTVYYFLLSLCGNPSVAEDLMQETFLQAYLSLARYDGSCKISVWLCQIAKHLWYRYLEKSKREQPLAQIPDQISPAPEPEAKVIAMQEYEALIQELQNLSEPMRTVMYLRIFDCLSFREIGELLEKSENWARVTYFRGKEKLWKERSNQS